MSKVNGAKKLTDNRFLNLYELNAETKDNKPIKYLVASRAKEVEDLKAINHKEKSDAVAILGITSDKKVVLVRQYRYPVGDYIYELPAGLVDKGESVYEAAAREMGEETGLVLNHFPKLTFNSLYSSPGMTDETCSVIVGNVSGEVSTDGNEDTEDITVICADKTEVMRILENEKLCMKTALLLRWWLHSEFC